MRLVIINRTDTTQTIRKSNGDIVTINAYSPYILETEFKPEINFWTNCVDNRFIVTDKISELKKLVSSLPKNIVKAQKEIIENNVKETETKKQEEVVIAEKVPDTTDAVSVDNNNIINEKDNAVEALKSAYDKVEMETVENISNLTVKNLKILAEKLGVTLPNNAKKAEIVRLVQEAVI
jgi:hypothetical protein